MVNRSMSVRMMLEDVVCNKSKVRNTTWSVTIRLYYAVVFSGYKRVSRICFIDRICLDLLTFNMQSFGAESDAVISLLTFECSTAGSLYSAAIEIFCFIFFHDI
jgi:predicted ester cyclase